MEAPLCVRDTGLDARRRDQGQGTVGGVGGLEGAAGTSGGEGEGRCSMSGSEMDVESDSELGGDEGFKTSSVSEPLLQVDHNELQETLFFVDAVPVELGSEIQSFPVYDSEHAVWRCPIGAEPKDGAKNGWKPGYAHISPLGSLHAFAMALKRFYIRLLLRMIVPASTAPPHPINSPNVHSPEIDVRSRPIWPYGPSCGTRTIHLLEELDVSSMDQCGSRNAFAGSTNSHLGASRAQSFAKLLDLFQ
ncbi:hypothetical protein FRB93_012969 [Tulasnella sp. JGI-2019a]|nr:hypothetical protein FRB93_012969 [Tulasnella sp. JGI-2019a]